MISFNSTHASPLPISWFGKIVLAMAAVFMLVVGFFTSLLIFIGVGSLLTITALKQWWVGRGYMQVVNRQRQQEQEQDQPSRQERVIDVVDYQRKN